MRIILLNRGLHSHLGGDLVQIEETAAALRRQGVYAHVESNDPQVIQPSLASFDLAHIFHCNFGFSKANWQNAVSHGVPYVVTPIYYDADKSGMTYEEQREMLEGAAAVMPFSEKEAALIREKSGYRGPVITIPNGTDQRFHDGSDPLTRRGVLTVAAREGSKGTGIVKELCEELNYPFTLGQGVDPTNMPALYKSHRVFVHAADLEVMSLVIGEALCANCRVLATNTNPGNSWYPGLVEFTPHMPANREGLKGMLKYAYEESDEWDYAPNAAARKLTWDYVATQLKGVYNEVLNHSS